MAPVVGVGDEQPPAERERHDRARRVGGVGDDPAAVLAHALAPGALLGRQVAVAVGVHLARVDQQALQPAVALQRPQAQDRVLRTQRPQEEHPLRGRRERPRQAEAEVPCDRLAAGEGRSPGLGLDHAPTADPASSVRRGQRDSWPGRTHVQAWQAGQRVPVGTIGLPSSTSGRWTSSPAQMNAS